MTPSDPSRNWPSPVPADPNWDNFTVRPGAVDIDSVIRWVDHVDVAGGRTDRRPMVRVRDRSKSSSEDVRSVEDLHARSHPVTDDGDACAVGPREELDVDRPAEVTRVCIVAADQAEVCVA